ncbi:hypothetical protein GTU71_09485 [Rathayibacter sp. VKM Ac-2762]|uniref:hypothetical protein n=1 Tax=Rathayibacter sp. VKM Ac-2762 TaxID=2609254 RepID=UPI00132E957E|nr:hypothetical protein [Rathayibacter sp. VKM Ac-2762]QHF21039.1 hypothetical protein GTU71_09485 [Rathayibacter sp. VKM Ac-2762]
MADPAGPSESGPFDLVPGTRTTRREIHARFGGDWRRGISVPRDHRNIFVFTDPVRGAKHGYDVHEGLTPEGVFLYTGEGPSGDQDLNYSNRALRDADATCVPVRVFAVDGTYVTYVGLFVPDDPPYSVQFVPSVGDTSRSVLVFALLPVDADTSLLEAGTLLGNGAPEISEWREPAFGEIELAGGSVEARSMTRVEFELQRDFGRWLIKNDMPPRRMRLAVRGGRIEPDLYVPSTGWIVEAKKSTARSFVRTAIGQVLEYTQLARDHHVEAKPMILLPGRPEVDLLRLLSGLSIIAAVRDGSEFALQHPTR